MRTIHADAMSPKQAAQHLGITQPMLAWAANQGAIPRVKRGRGWTRYRLFDLERPAVKALARKIRNHEQQVRDAALAREQAAMAAKLEEATR